MPIRLRQHILIVTAIAIAAACGQARDPGDARRLAAADSVRADSIARARQDSINRTLPGYVVDSIFPPEEEIRRFRAAIGGPPVTRLAWGAATRDELVARFVAAAIGADTAALHALTVSVREFADLYYPTSAYARPPYRQPPAIAWKLIQLRSDAGMHKVVQRYAGRSITIVGVRCEPRTTHEGANTLHTGCLVDVREGGGPTVARRLFGSILERDGQFKFVSYSNQF